MSYPRIYIAPKMAKRFLQGSPWIYANEIIWDETAKTLPPGSVVEMIGHQDQSLGLGFYHKQSLIVFRLLACNGCLNINTAFFCEKIKQALMVRMPFYQEPFYRLVHAQADGLDGFIIDRFGETLVVQLNSAGAERYAAEMIEALDTVLAPKTILVQRDSHRRLEEKLPLAPIECIGAPLTELEILENGARYRVPVALSQKTGWFYDHRDNRATIAKLAKGKTVLDYFCYAGGFAINCALAGAQQVIGIDRAAPAIEIARNAAVLNQVANTTTFVVAQAFEDMEERTARNETADLLILDPPAFIKTKKDIPVGLKGYQKLITKALPLVNQGGFLLIASCSYHLSEADLKQCLAKALHHHQREGRLLLRLSTGSDHPKHPFLEEVDYLKGFLVKLI